MTYVYTVPKDVTPIISDIKGCGLQKRLIKEEPTSDEHPQKTPTDDNTDQLIDHAKALTDTAKTFVTKLAGRKHGRKHSVTSPVETDVKTKALDMLHGETMNKLTLWKWMVLADPVILVQTYQSIGKSSVKCVMKYLVVLRA